MLTFVRGREGLAWVGLSHGPFSRLKRVLWMSLPFGREKAGGSLN